MTHSRRRLLARLRDAALGLSAAAVLALGPAGCGDAGGDGDAAGQKTFRFINRGDVITLDLNQMSYLQDFRITYAMREGLFTYDPNQNFKALPALAASHETSPDQLTWTFKLRPDAKWADGTPVTAGDFLFSWRLMLESPGEYTYLFYYLKNAKAYEKAYLDGQPFDVNTVGMAAPDDQTLVVTLQNPVPFLPDLLAFPPFYPRHAKSMEPFKQTGENGKATYAPAYTRPENVVGNGPFKLTVWEPGKRLRLEKSDSYWDKANVELDAIEMVVNNDPQSAFVQYDQGKVDWLADVAPELAFGAKQQGRPDLRVNTAFGTAFFTVNCAPEVPEIAGAKNPLADVRVRRALAHGIDKDYIVRNITRMGEPVASAYVPPGFFDGWQSTPSPGYDLEAAKRLLAEAGFEGGRGMPTLAIAYNSDSPARKQIAEYLAFQWRNQLGVPVDLKPLELKTYRSYLTTKQYTLGLAAWYGDYMDPSTFTDKYRRAALNNDSNWGPDEYERLVEAAEREPDPAKRQDLLERAEAMINTDLPIIPLFHYVNVSMHRDHVVGNIANPKNLVVWKDVDLRR